jgi:hypothetical protein
MTVLVPVTSWSRKLRHYAYPDALREEAGGGRVGQGLCHGSIDLDVYDQAWLDLKREVWFGKPAGSQLITEMPECKRCARAAARLAEAGEVTPNGEAD